MATSCLRSAQSSCNIFVVSENKITVKMVNNSVTNGNLHNFFYQIIHHLLQY